jgi:hypothetical protein
MGLFMFQTDLIEVTGATEVGDDLMTDGTVIVIKAPVQIDTEVTESGRRLQSLKTNPALRSLELKVCSFILLILNLNIFCY